MNHVAAERLRRDTMVLRMAREVPDGAVCVRGLGTPLSSVAIAFAREGLGRRIWVVSTEGGDASLDGGGIGLSPELRRARPRLVSFAELILEIVPRYQPFELMRPAQLDGQGRSNNVRIDRPGGDLLLPGCGGIADATSVNGSLVYYLPRHDRRSLVAAVDFASGAGRSRATAGLPRVPRCVITDMCVLTWSPGRATVESLHPGVTPDDVARATTFAVAIPDGCPRTDAPTADDLAALDRVDPHRLRDLEFLRGEERSGALRRAVSPAPA